MKCPYCNGSGEASAEQLGFGGMVLIARHKAGLNQQQLADAVGIGRSQVANIEAGRSEVPVGALRKYADALGISPLDLVP